MKRQNISQVVLPDGRIIAKTGTYSHVLVHNSYQPSTLFINVDLIKSVLTWSNSLAKLQDKLEFLVKCGWNRDELVIIETICGNNYNMKQGEVAGTTYTDFNYKIIIPQEELKCTCKEHDPYCCQVHGTCPTCVKQQELKQFSMTEAAKETTKKYINEREKQTAYLEFIAGAKWQADKMYSEEDLKEAFKGGGKMTWTGVEQESQEPYYYDFKEWLEQHKKK
jgi:hypothetical protein